MARDTELSTYVDAETKAQLQREADERDITLSTHTAQLIDRGRTANAEESMTSRTDVEAALERTIEESIASYHDELLDAVRKASVYSIANYELDATTADASGATRQDTFATGRRRTHTPLSEHEATVAVDSATGSDPDESDDADPEPESASEESTGSLTDITRGG